jgi:aryl-alcohol dehydrogenase-like predicted oxidoreductase
MLDVPEDLPVPPETLALLQEMRTSGRVRMLGVAGGDATERHLDSGVFDVLATSFNIKSGWRERNRLKRAFQADMPIIGCEYQPFTPSAQAERIKPAGPLGLGRLLGGGAPKAAKLAKSPYAFLEDSNGWTAEEICLGYALTEPSLTTVQTTTQDPDHLHRLALVTDRDLPTGISAQIEMARFSESATSGAA